jgi:hypothetical protein
MTAGEILRLTDPKVLFGANIDLDFRALARTWHPDTCKDPKALDVFQHLGKLREAAHRGLQLDTPVVDRIDIPGGTLTFEKDKIVLQSPSGLCLNATRSLAWLRKASPDMLRRVPEVLSETDTRLELRALPDSISLAALLKKYPKGVHQRHVAWIVSRLFELVMESTKLGKVVCCGLVPESLLLLITDHGVVPLDWRFSIAVGSKLTQVPGALTGLVPKDKKATADLDLRSIHRLALILLGDPSGIGNVLLLKARREPTELSETFLNWFRAAPNPDPVVHYTNYRQMLEKVWGKPKYFKLEL